MALYGAAGANRGGTGVYTRRLARGFSLAGCSSVTVLKGSGSGVFGKLFSEYVTIPGALRKGGYDLLHLPAFGGRVPGGMSYAVTIHDMAFLRCPGWFPPLRSLYYRFKFPAVARKASVIIADSEFTVSEIDSLLGLESTRVYLSAPLNTQTDQLFRKTWGVDGPYVLYTGTVEPRKNIAGLLGAWPKVLQKRPKLKLVLMGRWGWGDSALRSALGSVSGVLWTGPVPGNVLRSAVAGAEMLAYPSLYEGFGLPPLEAAAAGTPFMIGPAAALKEVYGEVAASVCGNEPDSMADSILQGLEAVTRSDVLRDFALGFSLESTALGTLQCYRRVTG